LKEEKERMLAMEQIYRIRNLTKIEGKSLREAARVTGHDFETVKKYTEKEDFNKEICPRQRRQGKLSPYKSIVTMWLTSDKAAPRKQRHTAQRVYNRAKEMYGAKFTISDRSVRKLVAEIRAEIETKPEGFLPLEHPPGEAQTDFGEVRFIENGTEYDGYYLNIVYPYSNGGHTQLFKSVNRECLFEGMKAIFEHIGGVPFRIWFDNMSAAVKNVKAHGQRDITDDFLRFMMHYGFGSNFCNPASGHEKGSVENKVGYHRRNLFVPVPEFKDLRTYNKELLHTCDKDMNREHYKGYGLIRDLFLADKAAFLPLPGVPYEVFTQKFAKADNYGKVKFDNRIYSAGPRLAGCEVLVKAGAYDITILNSSCECVASHRRLYGEAKESMDWLPYLELLSKRPTALKYTGLYSQLPPILKEHRDQSEKETK
jgi:transposase